MDVKNKHALTQRNEKALNAVSITRIPVKASKITRGHSVDRIPEYFGPPGLPGPVLFYS
nr:acinetodin/klebsidin/J25 family lasso peptide [Enterobacter kobei]